MKAFGKLIVVLGAVALLGTTHSQATVSLNLEAGLLHGPTVGTLAGINSTAVILIDTDNDGFGSLDFGFDPTLSLSQWTADSGDVALGPFPVGLDVAGVLTGFTAFDFVNGISPGDDLLLVWYPSLTYNAGLQGPGQGTQFGTYRTDAAATLPKINWNVPADGTFDLVLNTVDLGGSVAEADLVANQTTAAIPEPSTIMLLGFSGLSLLTVLRRRR